MTHVQNLAVFSLRASDCLYNDGNLACGIFLFAVLSGCRFLLIRALTCFLFHCFVCAFLLLPLLPSSLWDIPLIMLPLFLLS